MPKEIYYHPTPGSPDNYVIDARCPEHKYRPMKFDEVHTTRCGDGVILLMLHCPICELRKQLKVTTAA